MPKILTRILQSNFELIRDRIGAILADEFAGQQSYGDSDLSGLKVWSSRSIAFDKEEMPAINVNFVHGDYFSQDASANTLIYKFSIDVHASSNSANNVRGDARAMNRMNKIMGIATKILNHQEYRTLLFPAPSVQNKWIETLDVADVMRNDADSLIFGRAMMSVRINEDKELYTGNVIKGIDTIVKLELTDKGYFFRVNYY